MIKELYAFFSVFVLLACSKENNDNLDMKRELTTKALTSPYVVTETMARAFAESTFPSKNIRDISKVDKNGRTVLWIINFNDGWIVVSGDKRTTIILTQNNEGEYHYGESIPSVDAWIDGYAEDVNAIAQSEGEGDKESLDFWESIYPTKNKPGLQTKSDETNIWVRTTLGYQNVVTNTSTTPHLMSTHWGQDEPWNENTPYYIDNSDHDHHYPVGCAAVALGQILYYYHNKEGYPTGLFETVVNNHYLPNGGTNSFFQHSNYVTPSSRWDAMALDSLSSNNTSYVADFLGDLGHMANMNYGVNSSIAYFNSNVLSNYGLTCSTYSPINYSTILSEIENDYPVYMYAKAYIGNSLRGHMFVADGSTNKEFSYTVYYEWHMYPDWDYINNNNIPVDFYLTDEDMQSYDPNMYEGKQTSAHSNYSKDYILMNWGWDGSFDSVECGAVSYDSWSLYSNPLIQYDYSRLMIYNIRTP